MRRIPPSRVPGLRRLPAFARRGVEEDLILFESWGGRFSDSPRAIFEELCRVESPLRRAWVLDRPEPALPAGTIAVRPGSLEHLRHLASARHIISSNTMPGYFRKNPGTTFLQTWHGTPLKRIGFDIENPAFAAHQKILRHLAREVTEWDFLISPNSFSTEVFRGAFHYEGPILETGYPRNDLLVSPEATSIRARTRAALGIVGEAPALLYAPTWRDDARAEFSSRLDLGAVADAQEDLTILLRAHQLDSTSAGAAQHARVRDVSGYPDVRDLYLAADVLVTDYSSVMFDFAVTGKPMLFFTYDLEHYRDNLRGFYFDFEAEAPGPLLTSTEAVIEALHGIHHIYDNYSDNYRRFREKFCHLDDGQASRRVIELVLSGS